MDTRRALLDRFARDFIGLDRRDPVVGPGGDTRRASPGLPRYHRHGADAAGGVARARGYLEAAPANSHTDAHRAGRDTTRAIEDSRDAIGRLVGYTRAPTSCLFTANGATGAINFFARALFPPELRPLVKRFPDGAPPRCSMRFKAALGPAAPPAIDELLARPLVVTTVMEHHSNLLPWMEAVGHHNVRAVDVDPATGALDLAHLARILDEEGRSRAAGGRHRRLQRHRHQQPGPRASPGWPTGRRPDPGRRRPVGAPRPGGMHPGDAAECLDYLVLSGHKLYAPGSRGALIGNLQTLTGRRCVTDVGGGMVEYVSLEDFEIKDQVTAREEAGTPNILGSIAMGLVAETLMAIGMDTVDEAEAESGAPAGRGARRHRGRHRLREHRPRRRAPRRRGLLQRRRSPPRGGRPLPQRLPRHRVRNECFCAHPYVKRLLLVDPGTEVSYRAEMKAHDRRHVPGAIRASLGVYSTGADVDALVSALTKLVADREAIAAGYEMDLQGTCRLVDGTTLPTTYAVGDEVRRWLDGEGR